MGQQLAKLADAYLNHYRRTQSERAAGREVDADHADWEVFGAVDRMALSGEIDDVWELNTELVKRCESIAELAYVAAGPVEDMMNRLDETWIAALMKKAGHDPRWKFAIGATYASRMSPRLASIVERIQRESTEEQRAAQTRLSRAPRAP